MGLSPLTKKLYLLVHLIQEYYPVPGDPEEFQPMRDSLQK